MCGIAGYSFGPGSSMSRTLAAQALLAGIAERGADAVGYAHRAPGARSTVHKQQTRRERAARARRRPRRRDAGARPRARLHEGPPHDPANNHPVRHGRSTASTTGSSSTTTSSSRGTTSRARSREMTVDSEAIFALVDELGTRRASARAAASARWPPPGSTSASPTSCTSPAASAGRSGSARGRDEVLLRLDARRARGRRAHAAARRSARPRSREGRSSRSSTASSRREQRWSPDRSYREERELPAVRAPHEGRSCLERLAALAALG